jgi:hypothetical protein
VAAVPVAHAAPQENPSDDSGTYKVCSNLRGYIFAGGTAGFGALRDGDRFEKLLKTGRVGLYEHVTRIVIDPRTGFNVGGAKCFDLKIN